MQVPIQTSAARHLGAAASLRGDPAQAEAYYRQALEVCGRSVSAPRSRSPGRNWRAKGLLWA